MDPQPHRLRQGRGCWLRLGHEVHLQRLHQGRVRVGRVWSVPVLLLPFRSRPVRGLQDSSAPGLPRPLLRRRARGSPGRSARVRISSPPRSRGSGRSGRSVRGSVLPSLTRRVTARSEQRVTGSAPSRPSTSIPSPATELQERLVRGPVPAFPSRPGTESLGWSVRVRVLRSSPRRVTGRSEPLAQEPPAGPPSTPRRASAGSGWLPAVGRSGNAARPATPSRVWSARVRRSSSATVSGTRS